MHEIPGHHADSPSSFLPERVKSRVTVPEAELLLYLLLILSQ